MESLVQLQKISPVILMEVGESSSQLCFLSIFGPKLMQEKYKIQERRTLMELINLYSEKIYTVDNL